VKATSREYGKKKRPAWKQNTTIRKNAGNRREAGQKSWGNGRGEGWGDHGQVARRGRMLKRENKVKGEAGSRKVV